MAEILRYVLVDREGIEEDYEYDSYQEAVDDCGKDCAVIERTYVYDDSKVVYTPDGSREWPSKCSTKKCGGLATTTCGDCGRSICGQCIDGNNAEGDTFYCGCVGEE